VRARCYQRRIRILQSVFNAFKIPDLRRKIIFTMLMLLVFRVIAHIPVPGVDLVRLEQLLQEHQLLGMLNLFSCSALRNFSIAAMGVYPGITATIIFQLFSDTVKGSPAKSYLLANVMVITARGGSQAACLFARVETSSAFSQQQEVADALPTAIAAHPRHDRPDRPRGLPERPSVSACGGCPRRGLH